jgi:capsular exopolysaccharide synthesis family protein
MVQENNKQVQKDNIVVTDYLHFIKSKWVIFIISIVCCLIIASLYIVFTPKVYERSAQVMLKDDGKQGMGALDEVAFMKEINFFPLRTNINNEVELLRSKKLMSDVVERLQLNVKYTIKNIFRTHELYSPPIGFVFLDGMDNDKFSFTITPKTNSKVVINNFKVGSIEILNYENEASLGDTISTPIGKIVLLPTSIDITHYLDKPIDLTKWNSEHIGKHFSEKLDVSINKNSSVIKLSIKDYSIVRADNILNTLLEIYNEEYIAYRKQIIENTSLFIDERLKIIENELNIVDKDISDYKSSNMIADIKASSNLFLKESSDYDKQAFDLQNQLSVAEFIKTHLADPKNKNNLIPSNSGIENNPIEKQISEYNASMLQKSRLIENGSENSPAIKDLTNSLNAMKQSITTSIDNLIAVLKLQIIEMKGKESQMNQKIADIPETEKDIASIERYLKIQENLYLYLLQKREENELARSVTTSNFRMIDKATGSSAPIKPRKILILALAVIVGICIPCFYFFIKQLLSVKIQNPSEIKEQSLFPFLGSIPLLSKREKMNNDIIVVEKNNATPIGEAFRMIRNNIDSILNKHDTCHAILFTSLEKDSGKSFTSLNTAISFALTGKKVLFMDFDLHNKHISNLFGASVPGITDCLLNDTVSIDDIISKNNACPDMDFIFAGKTVSNPSDALANNKLEKIFSDLTQKYDYIFIDTASINMFADVSIIAQLSELVLFVICENLTDRNALSKIDNLQKNSRYNNIAILYNKMNGN